MASPIIDASGGPGGRGGDGQANGSAGGDGGAGGSAADVTLSLIRVASAVVPANAIDARGNGDDSVAVTGFVGTVPVDIRLSIGGQRLIIKARGGDGGPGGNGGRGMRGYDGRDGMNASHYGPGTNGEDGGQGGPGGPGGCGGVGGNGGYVTIEVAEDDMDLLMMINHDAIDVSGGRGGDGGFGGPGGPGGRGGRGGASFTWQETFYWRDNQGVDHPQVQYYNQPGGYNGYDGPPGFNGYNGAGGLGGRWGLIQYIVNWNDGRRVSYPSPYSFMVQAIRCSPTMDHGVFEPGDTVSVWFDVANIGGMPSPTKQDTHFSVIEQDWILRDLEFPYIAVTRSVEEKEEVTLGPLTFKIKTFERCSDDGPFLSNCMVQIKGCLLSTGYLFPHVSTQVMNLDVQWPVKISRSVGIKTIGLEEMAIFVFELECISTREVGPRTWFPRKLKRSLDLLQSDFNSLVELYLFNNNGDHFPFAEEKWDVQPFAPHSTRLVKCGFKLKPGVADYFRFVGNASLSLGPIWRPEVPMLIQKESFSLQYSPSYSNNEADVLIVINEAVGDSAIQRWKNVFLSFGMRPAIWNASYYNGIDLFRPLEMGNTLGADFQRRHIVFLNNRYKENNGYSTHLLERIPAGQLFYFSTRDLQSSVSIVGEAAGLHYFSERGVSLADFERTMEVNSLEVSSKKELLQKMKSICSETVESFDVSFYVEFTSLFGARKPTADGMAYFCENLRNTLTQKFGYLEFTVTHSFKGERLSRRGSFERKGSVIRIEDPSAEVFLDEKEVSEKRLIGSKLFSRQYDLGTINIHVHNPADSRPQVIAANDTRKLRIVGRKKELFKEIERIYKETGKLSGIKFVLFPAFSSTFGSSKPTKEGLAEYCQSLHTKLLNRYPEIQHSVQYTFINTINKAKSSVLVKHHHFGKVVIELIGFRAEVAIARSTSLDDYVVFASMSDFQKFNIANRVEVEGKEPDWNDHMSPIILKSFEAYLCAEQVWMLGQDSRAKHSSLEKNIDDIRPRLKRLERFLNFHWSRENPVIMKLLDTVLGDFYYLSRCARSFMSKILNSGANWHAAVSGTVKEYIKLSSFGGTNQQLKKYFAEGKSRLSPRGNFSKDQAKEMMQKIAQDGREDIWSASADEIQEANVAVENQEKYRQSKGCPQFMEKLYAADNPEAAKIAFARLEEDLQNQKPR